MDAKALFKLFMKFGVVKDVFIPFKRRKVTKSRFGFVRFDCQVAANIAIQKANGLWVDDRSLQVKFVDYDRSKKVELLRRPQSGDQRINGRGSELGKRSFMEALQGMAAEKTSMTIPVNEDGHGWLLESVIMRLKIEVSIHSIQKVLNEKGLGQIMVRCGGGRDVVLTFKSQEIMKVSFGLIKECFDEWCEWIVVWEPGLHIQQARCVWPRCFGVPLNVWNRYTFNRIGTIWGNVIRLEEDIFQPSSFCYGKVCVATKSMEYINTTIILECKGSSYPVLLCEEQIVDKATISNLSPSRCLDGCCSNVGGNLESIADRIGHEKGEPTKVWSKVVVNDGGRGMVEEEPA
ncbi:hypothetical protein ACSBR2_041948 [Camellia fascicularis]